MENQQNTKIEVVLSQAEVNVINLTPGDTLVVKLRGDELADQVNMRSLQEAIQKRFPDNKIMLFWLPDRNDLDLEVIKALPKQENSCNSANFCADCNCGKKAAATLPIKPLRELTPEEHEHEEKDAD